MSGFDVGKGIIGEAIASLGQRPSRTLLTMLGTVLGVGSFVAVLGLTATAAGQISTDYSTQVATAVEVRDAGTPPASDTVYSFPANADAVADKLGGVRAAGVSWAVPGTAVVAAGLGAGTPVTSPIQVMAATSGFIAAALRTWTAGMAYTQFQQDTTQPVVVLGPAAARHLGVTEVGVTITINGFPYQVVGILANVETHAELLASVLLPATTALAGFGAPATFSPATMLIRTDIGAAHQVASEVAVALRPDNPALFAVVPPADPPHMATVINSSMQALLAGLAVIMLLIGGAAIANTTLVSVMERTPEIGLRRALGASGRHITAQFLVETMLAGTVAGLVGASLGLVGVIAVALALHWTAVIAPGVVMVAPGLGAGVGLLAGAYPAWKAGRLDPIAALRR